MENGVFDAKSAFLGGSLRAEPSLVGDGDGHRDGALPSGRGGIADYLVHTGLDDHGWYAKDRDVRYTAEQRPRRVTPEFADKAKKK